MKAITSCFVNQKKISGKPGASCLSARQLCCAKHVSFYCVFVCQSVWCVCLSVCPDTN